jgi:hypothetical protein
VPVLWLGRSTGGIRLDAVTLEKVVEANRAPRRRAVRSTGVAIQYRLTRGAGPLQVYEARQPLAAYAFNDRLTFGFDSIPGPGSMQLVSSGGRWLGQLHTRRLYVTLIGADPATIVQAARQLRPVSG